MAPSSLGDEGLLVGPFAQGGQAADDLGGGGLVAEVGQQRGDRVGVGGFQEAQRHGHGG